ncbi:hypothetical protein D6833_06200 [Candidatus Parcubacteria bacterium]|nr:MAG: hypothetical protein D6833_06200 [Candidatus Parcubacteria bacterium]
MMDQPVLSFKLCETDDVLTAHGVWRCMASFVRRYGLARRWTGICRGRVAQKDFARASMCIPWC